MYSLHVFTHSAFSYHAINIRYLVEPPDHFNNSYYHPVTEIKLIAIIFFSLLAQVWAELCYRHWVLERLWSYLRGFKKITKEMSTNNRQDLLSEALLHMTSKTIQNFGKYNLYNNYVIIVLYVHVNMFT